MLRNYFISVWRYIARNKVFTTINILGLVMGMTAFILIGQYVVHETSYDRFWKNYDKVYRVQLDRYNKGELTTRWAAGAAGIGPDLLANFPEVEAQVRMRTTSSVLSNGDTFFQESYVFFAGKDFFKVFGYPLVEGVDSTALDGLNKIVISESLAKKYFGNESALGKTLKNGGKTDFEVTGIFKDLPENSHMRINAMMSMATFAKRIGRTDETEIKEWHWDGWLTYIKLAKHADAASLEAKLPDFVTQRDGEELKADNAAMVFHLQALPDIHLDSDFMMEIKPNGSRDTTYFLSVIAVLIILIAWINYINLSTAKSIERAREVGVRKVMGGYRSQLVQQFLSESIFLNTIAVLTAVVAVVLLTPWFGELTGRSFGFSLLKEPGFWLFIVVLVGVGSLLSGLYPAFVLSSYKPVDVLKGRFRNTSSGAMFRKGMVIVQFIASITLIVGTYTVYQQIAFMRNQKLGVHIDQTLVINTPAVTDSTYLDKYQVFKNAMLAYPEVTAFSSATAVPGRQPDWNAGGIRRLSQTERDANQYRIIMMDYDYVKAYGLEVVAGRSFSDQAPNESANVMLNESAARLMGFKELEESVNDQIYFWGDTFRIVGVLKDYHQESLKKAVEPLIYRYYSAPGGYYSVKMNVSNAAESIQKFEGLWKEFYPGSPFSYFFLDDYYNEQYKADQQFGKAFGLFSVLAIFIACLGLFGLSSLMAIQRTKEIGVRKVLGASVGSILTLVGKDLLILIAIAVLVATPIAWYVMSQWLQGFEGRINMGVMTFVMPCAGILLLAAFTISIHTLRAARTNPVKSLRYE
ncbi:MAG TPA: ABC transporter permease [Cyclobacteriaceae bacterium]|nr:ABC transporter permease [Cyclobacteriaceae bacterium]